jgi:RNA polymerase sigma-70 factor (ECF subfamily)
MKNVKEKQFEELVKQYKRTIYSVCYMFSRDKEEINDLFQEILVRLWLGFDQFEQRSSVNTWVYRIALNTAINSDKRAKRRPQTVPLSTDIDPYDPQDSSLEQVRQLYALINQLDVMDRGLVLLWLEGIGYDEIAAIMGITVANVGIKLHRIKEKLVQKSKSVTHYIISL